MKQFIKQTIASTIGTFLGLSIFFAMGACSLLFLVIQFANHEGPSIKKSSVLSFNLSTIIKDSHSNKNISQILSNNDRQTLTLKQVLDVIKNAGSDKNIKAILLDGRSANNSNGYASLTEIRRALQEFKKNGKKIIA
jgi:protease-4